MEPAPLSPPAQLGRYRLGHHLASGGCGAVWVADDPLFCDRVAIKVAPLRSLDGGSGVGGADRLLVEGRMLRELDSRNIVRALDGGEESGFRYLVMGLASRGTLGTRLTAGTVGDPWTTARIGRDLRNALSAVHRAGIVHVDVNPANLLIAGPTDQEPVSDVLLEEPERLVLADFGVAERVGVRSSHAWFKPGTRRFFAPERESRGRPARHESDVYSATAVIVSVISGSLPPLAGDVDQLASEIRPEWAHFVARGMARDPDARFASMDDWHRALLVAINTDLTEAGIDPIDSS